MVKFVSQPLELYNTGTADALYLESSDAGSSAGPVITLKRNSPSPASADYIGQLKFKGESSTGAERVYAKITAKIDDPTNAAEDGIIEVMNRFNGSEQIALRLKLDSFRILNNVNLFVDGGNTGLGQTSASERLDVNGNIAVSGTVDGRDVATDGTNQDALQTLTGIAAGTANLGTFTGTTIADSSTIKAALQALETKAEASIGASAVSYSTQEDIYDGATEVGTALDNLANGLGSLATKSAITSSDITDGAIADADIGVGVVGLNKITPIGPETILGNSSTLANGSPSALSATAVKTILSIANTDVSGLGTLSTIDDAPSDGTQYARQNGAWAAVTAAATTGSPVYMKRTGTGSTALTQGTSASNPTALSFPTLVEGNTPNNEITFSSGAFTVADAGHYRIGAYLTLYSAAGQRAQAMAEIFVNGTGTGDQRGCAYIRNTGDAFDWWAIEIAPEIFELSANDTIEIRVGKVDGANYHFSGNLTMSIEEDKSRIWLERVDAGEKGDTGATGPAGDALAGFNQTLTANRTIDDGDNGYNLFVDLNNGGASTAQLLVNPATPTVTMSANAGSAATTSLIQLNGSTMNLQFGTSAGLTVNAAAGSDGQALVTSGAGAPPEWGGYTVHRGTSAPTNTNMLWYNTTEEELFTYDSGRGHWFGAPYYISMGKTTSTTAGTGHFLYVGHQGTTATTAERGWLVPHDMTITGIRGHTQSTFDGWTFRVDKNSGGTNTTGVVSTGALGAVDTYSDFTLDADLAAADIIGMAGVNGSVTLNNTTFIIEVRRRL